MSLCLVVAGLLSASRVCALGPHEVLLLVNENSALSRQVANEYVHLREIPAANVVYLPLPDSVLEPPTEMSPADFTEYIWNPARLAMRERGIEDHILAWAYSADFPIRITSDPAVSIQGITFVRNQLPSQDEIAKGTWRSPLFAGSDSRDGQAAPGISLEEFSRMPGIQMPLPSMMLGFTGPRGSAAEEVVGALRRGAACDGARPDGLFVFVTSDDVRSRCREWQYPRVVSEIEALGAQAVIAPKVPREAPLNGLMMGTPWVEPLFEGGATYLPGCVIDHLTSAGAIFNSSDQSKITQWLNNGAVATGGTVTEPYAIWTKFPHARFFTHYISGATVLESFFLSLRCPLQILLLGDPLAKPWATRHSLTLTVSPSNMGNEIRMCQASLDCMVTGTVQYAFFINGVAVPAVAPGGRLKLDTGAMPEGVYELQAVAYLPGLIRQQVFARMPLDIDRRGRIPRLRGVSPGQEVDSRRPLRLHVDTAGEAIAVGVRHNHRAVARGSGSDGVLAVNPTPLGSGPVTLVPFARYRHGEVYGVPVDVVLRRIEQAPVIEAIDRSEESDGAILLSPKARSCDDGAMSFEWLQELVDAQGEIRTEFRVSGGSLAVTNNTLCFEPKGGADTCIAPKTAKTEPRGLSATISVSPGRSDFLMSQVLGILFNFRNPEHFDFFAFFADTSAWTLGQCRGGRLTRLRSVGRRVLPHQWYSLAVRPAGRNLEALVDGEVVLRVPSTRLGAGGVGLLAGASPAYFRDFRITPPCLPPRAFDAQPDGALRIRLSGRDLEAPVLLRVSDGFDTSERHTDL